MSLVIKKISPDVSDRHDPVSDRESQRPDGVHQYANGATSTTSLKIYGHRFQNGLVLAIGDIFALGLAVVLASGLRYLILGEAFDFQWGAFVVAAWLIGATLANLLPGWGLGAVEELKRIVTLLATVFGLLAVILFFSKVAEDVSRLTFGLTFAFATILVPLMRVRLKRSLIALSSWGVPSVIYGAGEAGRYVAKTLLQEQGLGYMPVGIFDDNPNLKDELILGIPVLGSTEHVSAHAPVAILAIPSLTPRKLTQLVDGPLSHYSKVLIIPNLQEVPSLWVRARDLGGILGLEITSNLYSPLFKFMKRAFDLGLTLATIIFWVPITVLLAALVWLSDRKNPFYAQVRVGRDGSEFKAWKLRSMVVNAEEVLQQSLKSDEALRLEWELYHKLRSDPRITPIGHVLRRLSLDELPQLLNVLAGDMSLVGPRPLPEYHHDQLNDHIAHIRQRVRPGLTGMWQVSGRSDTGDDGLERYDAYYVRNWSLWLDLVILVRTVRAVFKGTGAY
ncbi:MAG: undecaprenyl-phosphate galactose phosphotransferase WbaP [Rhodothermales bacterium]|nr:undecaprenyl-phosphate galactose phosphotransferase WbaP [Rhodothermales bacterium]